MADDKRLPQPAQAPVTFNDGGTATKKLPTTGAGCLLYASQPTGQIEWRHQWLPKEAQYSYDAVNGNRLTIPMRIRSTDYFKAIPGILGWAESNINLNGEAVGGPQGSLNRRLPIGDPDGQGMVALRIVNVRFEGSSKLKPGPLDLDAGHPSAVQPPRQPATPPGQADLFKDDCYSSPNVFEFEYLNGGGIQEAIKQTTYAKITIEFGHTFYPLLSDKNVSSSNPFGAYSEKIRYMWAQWDPTVEVVMSKTLTLKFGPGAVDGNGGGIANQVCATESPFFRPSGTLLVHWERVPIAGVQTLFDKFEFYEGNAFDRPLYGTVNQSPFKIILFNAVKTYAAETLMFMGCRPEPRWYSYGAPCMDLTYVFSYRGWGGDDGGRGWNYFLTGRATNPQPVRRQDGSKPYIPSDFEQLFRTD